MYTYSPFCTSKQHVDELSMLDHPSNTTMINAKIPSNHITFSCKRLHKKAIVNIFDNNEFNKMLEEVHQKD